MNRSVPVGAIRPLGDRALLIGVTDPAAGRRLAEAFARAAGLGDGVETVAGLATLMLSATDPDVSLDAVRAGVHTALAALGRGSAAGPGEGTGAGRTVAIPCVFDGPDLGAVATGAGCGAAEVVALLTGSTLTVSVMGFSPGFAYLDGLPAALAAIPRRDSPRPEVPAGSVALANGHAAIYPTNSPGGWQLVGRTGFPLFSETEAPYAALAPGDRVRFTVADDAGADAERDRGGQRATAGWIPPADARPVLEVVVPGLRMVLQDAGRRGVAAIGVPGAGPADPLSFHLANRLVGNADGAATLELTAGVAHLRCLEPCHVAAVGGAPEVAIDGRPAGPGRVVALEPGQVLAVGPMARGLRSYLSVAGGFLGPVAFGSMSSDELSGLGPGALGHGHQLHAGPWAPPLGDHLGDGGAPEIEPGVPVEVRVVPGPHPERFAPDALTRLADATFVVDDRSNRVGLRLAASAPQRVDLLGEASGELDSQGMVTGALQVPPGGHPIVLMPDHATLGGYPVVAVVISADQGVLGQCTPRTPVRFVPVDQDAAAEAAHAGRRALERAVMGHFPLAVD